MPRLRARRPPDARLPRARRSWPWVLAGLLLGALATLLLQAPAHWLAQSVASASQQRLLLTDTRGSLWSGSAVAVLSGGDGSRNASALPGRLQWQLGLGTDNGLHLALHLRQACCIDDTLRLRLEPGLGRLRVALPAGRASVGRWPASWLVGLGAPFNTLRLGGALRLTADALSVESVQGRWRVSGSAELELLGLSSPLTSLDTLGSYRLLVAGDGVGAEGARLDLATLQGPLRLVGQGQWVGPKLRFRGDARADPGSEALLNNLLNLMGQRQGALALLAIG
jgi:general secretion pathway protein N